MNPSRIHSVAGRRELRRLHQQQQTNRLFGKFLVFGALVLMFGILAFEIGRAYLRMQRVNNFIAALESNSPAAISAELDRFLPGLTDRNPLVRSASITAFKVATAWNLQPNQDAAAWQAAWLQHRHNWRYRPGLTNEPLPEVVSVHPYRSVRPPEDSP